MKMYTLVVAKRVQISDLEHLNFR